MANTLFDLLVSIKGDISNLTSTLRSAVSQVQQAGTQMQQTGAAMGNVFAPLGQGAQQAGQQVNAAGRQMTGVMQGVAAQLTAASAQIQEDLTSIGVAALKTGAAVSAISLPIIAVGKEALETAGKFEQWQIAFTTLLKSADQAKSFLDSLVTFALKTPFDIPGLVESAKRLLAFGFQAKEVIPILRTLGDAAAGLGLSQAKFDNVVAAFGKIREQGALTAMSLRQFALNGIDATNILAEKLGVSTAELFSLTRKKAIDAATATTLLLQGIAERFGGLMEKQSTTLLGMLSNLRDAVTKTMNEIGKTMLPAAKSIELALFSVLNRVQDLAISFAALPDSVRNFTLATTAAVAVAGPLLIALGGIVFALGQLSPVILAVTAGVTLAAGGFAALYTAFPNGTKMFVEVALGIAGVTLALQAVSAASAAASAALVSLSVAGGVAGVMTALGEAVTFAGNAILLKLNLPLFSSAGLFANLTSAVTLAAGAFAGWRLGEWLRDSIPALRQFADEWVDLAVRVPLFGAALNKLSGATDAHTRAVTDLNAAVLPLKNALAAHNIVVEQGNLTLAEYAKKLRQAASDAGLLKAGHDSEATSAVSTSLAHLALIETYEAAKKKVQELSAGYKNHSASVTQLIAAKNELRAAEMALHPTWDASAGKITSLTNSQSAATKAVKEAQKAAEDLRGAYEKLGLTSKAVHDTEDAIGKVFDATAKGALPDNASAMAKLDVLYQRGIITLPEFLANLQAMGAELVKSAKAADSFHVPLVAMTEDFQKVMQRGTDLVGMLPALNAHLLAFQQHVMALSIPVSQFDILNERIMGTETAIIDMTAATGPDSVAVAHLKDNLVELQDALLATQDRAAHAAEGLALMGTGALASSVSFATLGIQSQASLQQIADQAMVAYRTVADDGTSSAYDIERAWLSYYDKARAAGDTFSQATEAQTEQIRTKVLGVTRDLSTSWSVVGKQITQSISNDLSRAIGDAIFHIGRLTEAFKRMGQDVVDIILKKIIADGITKLLNSLAQVNGIIGTIAQKLGGIAGGGVPTTGPTGVTTPPISTTSGIPGLPSSIPGLGGGAGGGAASSLANANPIMAIIQAGISAASGIVTGFQLSHIGSDVNFIEKSTRFAWLSLGGGGNDIVGNTLRTMFNTADIKEQLLEIHEILSLTVGNALLNIDANIARMVKSTVPALASATAGDTYNLYFDNIDLSAEPDADKIGQSLVKVLRQRGIIKPR